MNSAPDERPDLHVDGLIYAPEVNSGDRLELDWFANSVPTRRREGSVNRTLRRFGLRLMRVSRDSRFDARKREWGRFANEDHHHVYGRPWYVGRDYFDLILSTGLDPSDRVLDFGCGSMRAGVWLAAFLNTDGYCGIDSHRTSLEAAALYEIPLHGLAERRPLLLHSTAFRVDLFRRQFDVVFAASVFRHLEPSDVPDALRAIRDSCVANARLIVQSSDLDLDAASLAELGFKAKKRFDWQSKFHGRSRWTEYLVEGTADEGH